MTATITTAELATELNTDPRTLRKFLRADAAASDKTDTLPGKGRRYALPANARSIASMRKKFAAWEEGVKQAKAVKDAESVIEVDDAETDIDPTDDDLDNLTDEVDAD